MAQLSTEITTSFVRGMMDDVAATRYPADAAALILNGRIEADGTVSRRDGSQRTHPTALDASTGFGGTDFISAAGTEQIVAFMGTKAFMSDDRGATWSTEGTGLRQDYNSFATMRVG